MDVRHTIQYTMKKRYMKSANFMRSFMNEVNKASVHNLFLRMFTTVPSMFVNSYTNCTTVSKVSPAACKISEKYLTV